jgi:hypothetical protein
MDDLATRERSEANRIEESLRFFIEVRDRKLDDLDVETVCPFDDREEKQTPGSTASGFVEYRDLIELDESDLLTTPRTYPTSWSSGSTQSHARVEAVPPGVSSDRYTGSTRGASGS